MHKKLFFIVLALLACQALFSQEEWDWGGSVQDKSYRFELDPKVGAGLTVATQPTNYSFSFNSGLAYQFGLSTNMHLGRRYSTSPGGTGWFGIEAEVMYGIRKLGLEGINTTLTMQCIEVPILAQFYPMPSLAIEVGPTLTKTLKCSPEKLQLENVVLNTGQLSSSDIMLTAGIAYKTPVHLMFDLRYNLGIVPLAGNFDSKVSTAMVSVAYLFGFGKNSN
jgi:hypothetical protein